MTHPWKNYSFILFCFYSKW